MSRGSDSARAKTRQRPKGVPEPPEIHPALDWRVVERLHRVEGLGPYAIARRTGYTYVCVNNLLREHGIRRRPPSSTTGKWAPQLYRVWKSMRARCSDTGRADYAAYSGRGVRVCWQWQSFRRFYEWARASGYRPGLYLVLDQGGRQFSPSSCRFLAPKERVHLSLAQGTRPAVLVKAFGQTKTIREWSLDRRCKVSKHCLRLRLQSGMLPEEAITAELRRTRGAPRLGRPVVKRQRLGLVRGTDWAAVERKWLRERTDFGELARRLGVTRATVLHRLSAAQSRVRSEERVVSGRERQQLYRRWVEMHQKCRNPVHKQYARIGAKGIEVCAQWQSLEPFCRWALASGYEDGRWLARKNPTRDFSPSNCIWLEESEARSQARLDSKPPRMRWPITAFGETRSPLAWANDRRCAVTYGTLLKRLHEGWDAEEAITEMPSNPVGGPPGTAIRAFGEVKSLAEWSRDPRCRVRGMTVRARLLKGLAPEHAIATPPYRKPRKPGRAVSLARRGKTRSLSAMWPVLGVERARVRRR